LKASRWLGEGKGTRLKQELDLFEGEVSEAMMPSKEFLVGGAEVEIVLRSCSESDSEGRGHCLRNRRGVVSVPDR